VYSFKTPPEILKRIEECREKKAKVLDLTKCGGVVIQQEIKLPIIPPEVFSLSYLEELNVSDHAIQLIPKKLKQLPNLKKMVVLNK